MVGPDSLDPSNGGGGLLYAIGSAITALVAGGFYFRQRISKDNTQIASDRHEKSLMDTLSRELANAMERLEVARGEHRRLEQRNDDLSSRNAQLEREVGRLEGQIAGKEMQVEMLSKQNDQLSSLLASRNIPTPKE